MNARDRRRERRFSQLQAYRRRARAERAAAKKSATKPRLVKIIGGRTMPINIRPQGVAESDAHYLERVRTAHKAKARTKVCKRIARASRRRNRR